jgi:ferredoxin-NADP reductase
MQKLDLKVADIQQLTSGIKRFEFVNAAGGDLPAFTAGAHIDFHLENGLIRSYSLANDPSETHRYVTAILREGSGGGGSIYMHDNVKVGDTLTITEPANNFALVDDASQHIMLAGGIGITPLMAMGYHLKVGGTPRHLHYCTKSREETAFADTVEELFGDDLTFYHDGGDPSKGINLAETFKDRPEGAHLYICGPGGLLKAAREVTDHWPAGTVHFELFQSLKTEEEKAADAAEQHDGDQAFEVELAQTGKTLTIPADKSILEVLWENDIEVMHACEEGWCGNCVVDYLGGGVDHRDEVLDEEEQKTKIQVCISRALPGEKIILDL